MVPGHAPGTDKEDLNMRVAREKGEVFPMFRICGRKFSNGCTRTLEIEENDIKKIIRRYSPEHPWPEYGFVCPKCHTFNSIDESCIPKKVQEKAEVIDARTLEPCGNTKSEKGDIKMNKYAAIIGKQYVRDVRYLKSAGLDELDEESWTHMDQAPVFVGIIDAGSPEEAKRIAAESAHVYPDIIELIPV